MTEDATPRLACPLPPSPLAKHFSARRLPGLMFTVGCYVRLAMAFNTLRVSLETGNGPMPTQRRA
jgi:hypothetical protein